MYSLKGHGICPLERHSRTQQDRGCSLDKLNFDPGQVTRTLHLLHLALDFEVQLVIKLGRLLVIGPSVKVLSIKARCEITCLI